MGSAYHWEARRRQMALDRRRWLMAQQQKQQEQELIKLQEEEKQPEESSQLSQGPQVLQPPPPPPSLLQQLPAPPQPPTPSRPQHAQDNLTQCTSKYIFKDTHSLGPQGGHQAGGQSNRFQDGLKTLPSPGPKNPCQPSPAKYKRFTRFSSINYKQQW